MFTVCPKCALTLVVTAADLRVAQGYVRCGRCSSVFNALAQLSDDRSATPAGSGETPASEVEAEEPESAPPAAVDEESPAPASPTAADDESIPEYTLEFNPETTDASSLFVIAAPSPEWTAATGSFKALVASEPEPAASAPQAAAPAPQPPPQPAATAPQPPAAARAPAPKAQDDQDFEVELDAALLSDIVQSELAPEKALLLGREAPTSEEPPFESEAPPAPARPTRPAAPAKASPAIAAAVAAAATAKTSPAGTAATAPAPAAKASPAPPARTPGGPAAPTAAGSTARTPSLSTAAIAAAAAARSSTTPAARIPLPTWGKTAPAPAAARTPPATAAATPAAPVRTPPAPASAIPVTPAAPAAAAPAAKTPPAAPAKTATATEAATPPKGERAPDAEAPALSGDVAFADFEAVAGGIDRPPARPQWQWAAGSALLVLVLFAQIVNHQRDALATDPRFSPSLTAVYTALGVQLTPRWDLRAYEVRQLGATVEPGGTGAITVRASIRNAGTRPQPLPLLRVTLQDRFGNRLASRDVMPRDYLPGGTAPTTLLAVDQRVDAELAFVDPGASAVGFELDACLPLSGGIVCANDTSAR